LNKTCVFALGENAADEIPALLEHPLQAKILRGGLAVEFRPGHMALLDAQQSQRLHAIGHGAGGDQRLPDGGCLRGR
jgi:hypothetical protein